MKDIDYKVRRENLTLQLLDPNGKVIAIWNCVTKPRKDGVAFGLKDMDGYVDFDTTHAEHMAVTDIEYQLFGIVPWAPAPIDLRDTVTDRIRRGSVNMKSQEGI